MAKTTPTHFKQFKAECERYVNLFGLQRYEVVYTHDFDEDARASVNATIEHGIAVINLSTEWGDSDPLNKNEIRLCALHEVRELFYWQVRVMLEPYYSTEFINQRIHALIRTDERTFKK